MKVILIKRSSLEGLIWHVEEEIHELPLVISVAPDKGLHRQFIIKVIPRSEKQEEEQTPS